MHQPVNPATNLLERLAQPIEDGQAPRLRPEQRGEIRGELGFLEGFFVKGQATSLPKIRAAAGAIRRILTEELDGEITDPEREAIRLICDQIEGFWSPTALGQGAFHTIRGLLTGQYVRESQAVSEEMPPKARPERRCVAYTSSS